MAAFESNHEPAHVPDKKTIDECLVALKIYDSCRKQDCLTEEQIGPARSAQTTNIGDRYLYEGEIIEPPSNAASVTVERLRVKRIIIVDKEPNPFKSGYWDIDLKYVFEYRLTFREADGEVIGSVLANNIYNKKVTLFGSTNGDMVMSTDLFDSCHEKTMEAAPFILAEAKAVSLCAELKFKKHKSECGDEGRHPSCVAVVIGLFSMVKLFRIVDLSVLSKGFCIPEETDDPCPTDPCEFFNKLDFPVDAFAPPQKKEYFTKE